MRIVLVGIYDTDTVSLAPQILAAVGRASTYGASYDIDTLEFSIFSTTADTIVEAIAASGANVVCFSAYIWNIELVKEIADRIDRTVIVGGPQVTGIERELLAEAPGIDIIVTGEGERTFVDLLAHLAGERDLASIDGVTTRELQTPPAEPTDLATIPPIYERILRENPGITWLAFETSRGCPMGCGYCTWGTTRRMRYIPLDRVIAELDIILAEPRIKEIYLCDSSLLLDKSRALAILDHIIESGSDTQIRYEFSPEQLDAEIIDRMTRLPTNEFNFGIQSIQPAALRAIGRPFRRERFERSYLTFVEAFPSAQITVDLIYGLPDDDLDGYVGSLDYVMGLPGVSRVLTNPLIVLPGSRFFAERDHYGIELAQDGSYMLMSNATFSASQMLEARRVSFLVNLVYLNRTLRDAVIEHAKTHGRRSIDVLIEFFDTLPFGLVEGDYPYTIPSVKEGFERRNRAFGQALAAYPRIVDAFAAYAGSAASRLLTGYEDGFSEQYRKYLRYASSLPPA